MIIQIVFGITASLLALISFVFFVPFRWPAPAMWGLKVVASALSSIFVLAGLLTLILGILTSSVFISLIGAYVALIYLTHFISVTRPPSKDVEDVFEIKKKGEVIHEQNKYFLSRRTILKLPSVPEPRFEQDISFATIPGTDRRLFCDIWQPHISIKPSGLAFIYMHGSAFYFLDKDYKTRPFFKHLAAQGHVIMDIAYRLAPETDLMGMIQDVKRAINWLKENSDQYGIGQVVLAGGSAGGYLALMAAYTANDSLFTPRELEGKDLSCSSVIGEYPATDLEALYYHTNQHLTTRSEPGKEKKKVPTEMPAWIKKRMGEDFHRLGMDKGFENVGTIAPLMGGHPDECPERYKFFSPITYVNSNCPPTLLIQGKHDIMAPVQATLLLYERLLEQKVPVIMHVLPQTDHGFDLFMPNIAPAAHNAFYDVERFLALMTAKSRTQFKFISSEEKSAV
jgi:acetyl esterase/lipase